MVHFEQLVHYMCGRLNESFEGRNENLKLDTTDLKLLEAIYGLQNLKTSDIAEKTGLSEITVKRRLRNLRKRGLFAKKYAVNYWKVKLIPLMVVGRNLWGKVDQAILDSFCRSVRTVMTSVSYHILDLIVPADDLGNILEYFSGSFKDVDMYFLKSFHKSVSFRFYDVVKNSWRIDYLALSLYIREIIVKEGYIDILRQTSPIKTIIEKVPSRPIKLSDKYARRIRNFETFLNRKNSFLDSNMGISKYTVYKIKSELKRANALKTYIDVYPPKLTEKLYLIIEKGDMRFLEALLLGLSELPVLSFYKADKLDASGRFVKENVIIARLELPEGGFVGFLESFTKMLIDRADFKLCLETKVLTPHEKGGEEIAR